MSSTDLGKLNPASYSFLLGMRGVQCGIRTVTRRAVVVPPKGVGQERAYLYKPSAFTEDLRPLISAEQIARRVREMAGQISEDFRGKRLFAVCTMQQGFVFMADLVRELEVPVACQFIRPDFSERDGTVQIFFSPEPKVKGADVLLVEAVVESGITTEFLVRTLLGLGAASVRIAALIDRTSGRRISLHPDYVGFGVEEDYVVGYGLGSTELGRNLPYLAIVAGAARAQRV